LRRLSEADRAQLTAILHRALNHGASVSGSAATDGAPALASPTALEDSNDPPPNASN
jgi:hypothetical protein